jgi:hypothetical protein
MKACSLRRGCAPTATNTPLRSGGRALDESVRGRFEPRFGVDFSRVRIHADDQAARSARGFGARAYTAGNHIAFDTGEYAPNTAKGARLLAHELTHVVQQEAHAVTEGVEPHGSTAEREADGLADAAISGAAVTPASRPTATVMRQLVEAALLGKDEKGKFCTRFYPSGGGKVEWSGVSQQDLNTNVRIVAENAPRRLLTPTANGTDRLDAIFFGPTYNRYVHKVPDHCTLHVQGNLSGPWGYCCNSLGNTLGGGQPRKANATDFELKNDWVPEPPPAKLSEIELMRRMRLETPRAAPDKTIFVPPGGQR